jgi:hypothetical protein
MTPQEQRLREALELLEQCRPTHFDFSGALVHHEKPGSNELEFDSCCPQCVIPKAMALLREALLNEPPEMTQWCCDGDGKGGHHRKCRYSRDDYATQATPPQRQPLLKE